MDRLTRAQDWFEYAEEDLEAAEWLAQKGSPRFRRAICYHCQQAAEKYLKGFIFLEGKKPARTHDLDYVRKKCAEINEKFRRIANACTYLTSFTSKDRYPPDRLNLNDEDVEMFLYDARDVRNFVAKLAPELKKELDRDKTIKHSYREIEGLLSARC